MQRRVASAKTQPAQRSPLACLPATTLTSLPCPALPCPLSDKEPCTHHPFCLCRC